MRPRESEHARFAVALPAEGLGLPVPIAGPFTEAEAADWLACDPRAASYPDLVVIPLTTDN